MSDWNWAGRGRVSSLRTLDLKLVDDLVDFVRGPGYVLEFSDRTFREFFAAEFNVDIDDMRYSSTGGSKGKRLRSFLQQADDETAASVLERLWEYRIGHLAQTGGSDPVHNAEGRHLSIIAKLRGNAQPALRPLPASNDQRTRELKDELYRIRELPAQRRGYAFEGFLTRSFDAAGLAARQPFRNTGEQIDGSFVLGDEVYLLEAKWQSALTAAADLRGFHGKLDQKAAWARGLFVSYNGFTEDGLKAFGTGKRIVCMDGRDICNALEANIPLRSVLERKIRKAAETGRIFVPVMEMFVLPSG